MAGLFEKDIRMFLKRKNSIIMVIVISIFVALSNSATSLFILAYFPTLITMIAVGTIAYDEMDNGYRFLMTLPVNEKVYVLEKYLFFICSAVLSWFVCVIGYCVFNIILHNTIISGIEAVSVMFGYMISVIVLMSVLVPLQFKYGVEKSRIVLGGTVGAVLGICAIVSKMGVSGVIKSVFTWLDSMGNTAIIIGEIIILAVMLTGSFLISLGIMRKKEF